MPEVITITDIRRAGHCAIGIRRWFESRGLDFRAFLRDGITVELFLATGDGMAAEVVRRTRERKHG